MHRNSSKSLRHVGKLGEGYLSDVHTSFSNLHYDSDASSDLMESSKVLEKQFKDKYKILRMAYERRIQQLTTTVESVCAKLLGDDLIASMKTDVASSFFIPAHISETLASFLQGERESDVQDLLERESALSIQLSRKNSIIDNQNSRIAELEEVGAKGKASEVELNSLQEKLVALEAQYSAYSLQSKEEVVESKRRREAEALKNQSLQDQLDKCQAELSAKKVEFDRMKADNDIKLREVYELEKSIQLTGRDMTHLSETESRQKIELDQCSQKLKRTMDQRDSLAADIQRLTEKLRYSSEDLEKAQASQEILLREKGKHQQSMDEAVAKSKRVLLEETEQYREEVSLAHKKIKNITDKFELDLNRERHATQAFKDEAAISKAMIEEKQREIVKLSNDAVTARESLENLHGKLTNVREILEETNVQLLRSKNTTKEWQSRAHEAENRINEMSFAHKKEKQRVEEQIQHDLEKQMEAERKQLESKSDVFRMHYQNQLLDLDISRTNMSLSRSMNFAPPPPPPRVDVRHSTSFNHAYDNFEQRDVHGNGYGEVQNKSYHQSDERMDSRMGRMREDCEQLQVALDHQRQEARDLEKKLQEKYQYELEQQRQQHQQQLQQVKDSSQSQLRAQIQNMEEKLHQLEATNHDLQLQYEKKKQETNSLLKLQHEQQRSQQQQEPKQLLPEQSGSSLGLSEKEVLQLQENCRQLQQQSDLYRQEAKSLQVKLQEAEDMIDIMKEMVAQSDSAVESHKATVLKQSSVIAGLEEECAEAKENKKLNSQAPPLSPEVLPAPSALLMTATSPTNSDIESKVVGITRVHKLEAEVVRLQGALVQAQAQAREDHEQDSVLLQSMQQKFESLVSNFESSRIEQNESFEVQEEKLSSMEEEVNCLKEIISAHESTIDHLHKQVNDEKNHNISHSEDINALEIKLDDHKVKEESYKATVQAQKEQICELENDLERVKLSSQQSGDNLLLKRAEIEGEMKAAKDQNKKLRGVIIKIDKAYRLQIRDLRTSLSRVKENVIVLERSLESEVETMNHKTEAFCRPALEAIAKKYEERMEVEKKRLSVAHMKEEKHLISTLKKRLGKERSFSGSADENDNASFNSNGNSVRSHETHEQDSSNVVSNISLVVSHYKTILKNIFELISASSIVGTGPVRDMLFYMESCNIKDIPLQPTSERHVHSIGVVSAKLCEMLGKELNKYVKEKERVVAQIELMSDLLRKEKIHSAELKMSFHQDRKALQEVESSHNISNGTQSLPVVVELESQIQKLKVFNDELTLRHKNEVDRLKLEWEQRELLRHQKLESQVAESEEIKTDLENKLRTEQTRRHHLQSRLVSEEAEHRSEMEDFEKRFFELQRRVNKTHQQ